MNSYIILAIVLLLANAIIQISKKNGKDDENLTKYNSKKTNLSLYEKKLLLTKPEYFFWKKLKSKCDENNIVICPKVRMEDFINIKSDDYNTRQKYRGYVKARHIDFVLCDSNLNMIAGIELDDKSHNKENVKKVDELKNDVFEAIRLPLYRIPANSKNYDAELERIFNELVGEKDEKKGCS